MVRFVLLMSMLFVNLIASDILPIDVKNNSYNILTNAEYFLDKSKALTINDMKHLNKKFLKIEKKVLSFGYAPDFNVWIKYKLQNNTNKDIEKIVEYENPLTTHISYFDMSEKKEYKEGLYQIAQGRKTINPIFKVRLKPYESKLFYIKASSVIVTLIVKLHLYSIDDFYEKEIKYQFVLALFFGSMLILGIYNLFIYLYTQDKSYLYYVLYIFGIIVHHMMYVGIGSIYILNQKWSIFFINYSSLLVAFPIYFLALFTKSFLKTSQYKVLHNILLLFLLLVPLSVLFFTYLQELSHYRNIVTYFLLFYLVYITSYAAYKKNPQAYFILFGWFIVFIAGSVMYTSSIGLFNIREYFPYIVELSFVTEAIVFSIALAYKIKQFQDDKINEKKNLEIMVKTKTIDLEKTLNDKNLLLKEINHRVKNNMQIMVSLIRLQVDEIEDKKTQEVLTTTYNRVNAMSNLHELLYFQEDISDINATDYFRLIADKIQESYSKTILLHLKIQAVLKLNEAVHCGLILNELITNAFKHAFISENGNIYIKLLMTETHYKLIVSDDGVGYNQKEISNSLGLTLVNSLAKSKLNAKVDIYSTNGVEVKIVWKI